MEPRVERPCACCGVVIVPTPENKIVSRVVMAEKVGDKPVIEEFHQRCYEYVKTQVEKYIKIERERKAG